MSALDDVLIAEAARIDALPPAQRVVELVKFSTAVPELQKLSAKAIGGAATLVGGGVALHAGYKGIRALLDRSAAHEKMRSEWEVSPHSVKPKAGHEHFDYEPFGSPADYTHGSTEWKLAMEHESELTPKEIHYRKKTGLTNTGRKISDDPRAIGHLKGKTALAADGLDVPYKAKPGAIDPATGKPHGKLDESKYQSPAETGAANAGAWGTLVGAIGLASGRELGIKRAIARGVKAGVVGAILGGAGGALAEHYGPRTRRHTPAPTKKTGKDGRAGRDGDGDGKKDESKKGGAGKPITNREGIAR